MAKDQERIRLTRKGEQGLRIVNLMAADIERLESQLASTKRQRDELFEAAKAIVTYWNNGNFSRREDLWLRLRLVVEEAEKQ